MSFGNNFMCDCRLSWMYLLRNETPNEQIRNSLDELTCHLRQESTDYQDHDANASADESTETSPGKGYVRINGNDFGHSIDSDEGEIVVRQDGRRGHLDASETSTSEPNDVKHLFDIPQEHLPCPEDLQMEPDPTFPFLFNAEFGVADANSGVRAHVVSIVLVISLFVVLIT
ncbi:hypothetical protein C0J52_27608 [Blattella germanica]|nr:hypothetical protein C0J52_27608 [Blattella germanica]